MREKGEEKAFYNVTLHSVQLSVVAVVAVSVYQADSVYLTPAG